MKEPDSACLIIRTALRNDDEVLPVQELSYPGGHSGGGETPVSV
jgi:hypothetical protein